MCSNCCCN
ncbi:hypothetical protein YPPY11_3836, partial [Yersinia pestis PY-11]